MVIWGRFESLLVEVDWEASGSLAGGTYLLWLLSFFNSSKLSANSSFVFSMEAEKVVVGGEL